MKPETLTTIQSVIAADSTNNPEHIDRIIAACRQGKPRRRLGTKHDAARILEVHPETVKRYGRQGLLTPIRRTSRCTRYDLDEVETFAMYGAEAVTTGEVV